MERAAWRAVWPEADPPFAKVAICTHDRASDLSRCLEGLMPQARSAGIPVVVVDSGSPKEAADEIARISRRSGARVHRLDRSGVSLARNEALRVCGSRWVLFLDDDAVPCPGWADGVLEALRSAPDEVAIVGGRILPAYPEGAVADHIDDEWLLLLSCVDDPEEGDVRAGKNICCANIAMRTDAVMAVGGFPSDLGRVGGRLISCEESFVIERVQDEGMRAVYDRRFAVDHHVPAKRLELDWARDRIFWESASALRMKRRLGRRMPLWANPLKLALSIPVLWIMGVVRGWPRSMTFRMARAQGALRERLGWLA